jgi:hypothetical protein
MFLRIGGTLMEMHCGELYLDKKLAARFGKADITNLNCSTSHAR